MIVYVGPTLKGIVRKNQIFQYDPVSIKEKAVSRFPYTKYLFVNMSEIVEVKKRLSTVGSLENTCYKKTMKQIIKEDKNG